MTLVIMALLFGLVGIVCLMALNIVWARPSMLKPDSRESKRLLTSLMHKSKAA